MSSFAGEMKAACCPVRSISDAASVGRQSPAAGHAASFLALVAQLPDSLEWGVLFRTGTLAGLASTSQLAKMWGFATDAEIEDSVCVLLTSAGECIAFDASGPLVWPQGAPPDSGASIADRFAEELANVPGADGADCLGFGRLPGLPPVVMVLAIREGVAQAEALFSERPAQDHYELLAAVGVRSLGGEQRGRFWSARFSNAMNHHYQAAALAGYARTANCNRFFLHHGRVDEKLEEGLLRAAAARVEHGLGSAITTGIHLALAARRNEMAMTCVPPAPQPPYSCGDLVPMGLLAYALGRAPRGGTAAEAAATLLRRHLERHRVEGLWPFHHGRLPTATDSALILLGQKDARGIEALERFADGEGGYFPQLVSLEGDETHMRGATALRHWQQPDFGTTCLVRALRQMAGLEQRTPVALLEAKFESRSALFFANPYLVDWALALAIAKDENAGGLRERLAGEILSSANEDGTFGCYDRPLSTALSIIALAALGRRDRTIRIAQLRLLEALDAQGHGPVTMPFYSSEELAAPDAMRGRGLALANGHFHALSFYEDTHRMVLHAFAVEALHTPCDPRAQTATQASEPHPRYRVESAARYIEAFALPPYLGGRA